MTDTTNQTSRRSFLRNSSAAVVGSSLATLAAQQPVHAASDNVIKVGLIGAGGRGSGAAVNASHAGDDVRITALCDVFPDRLGHAKNLLERRLGEQYAVTDEQCFSGFDGYKQLLETDVDVVCLCTPPHFRPVQLRAAIEAGKHVFCEKPVAVDAPGVRSVLETAALAKQKDLSIVSGLCWRYDHGVRATMDKIKNGEIGDIRTIQENYLTGTLWHRGRKPEWSEMEYQMRNWLYFSWLSGDHIVEQHVHSLDKAMWLNDDIPPLRCYGLGGRQVRSDEKWGHIYDHFAVCYEWKDGTKCFSYTRQMKGCYNNVEDYVIGTTGRAEVLRNTVTNSKGDWRYKGDKPSMYDVEHKELFAGIRAGKHINNGVYMSYSTLLAIIGREACYTGKSIGWDEAMASNTVLGPREYAWGDIEVPEVAVPGKTKFV